MLNISTLNNREGALLITMRIWQPQRTRTTITCFWNYEIYVRCLDLETEYNTESRASISISEAEVGSAVDELNNRKSADEYGLFSELFKAVKPMIVPVVIKLFNQILYKKNPESFKTGIITPVLTKRKIFKEYGKLQRNYCIFDFLPAF